MSEAMVPENRVKCRYKGLYPGKSIIPIINIESKLETIHESDDV